MIRGFDEGLLGSCVGEQRRLVIPPQLGYGEAGAGGVIPPQATLVFNIDIVNIQVWETTNICFEKNIFQDGEQEGADEAGFVKL